MTMITRRGFVKRVLGTGTAAAVFGPSLAALAQDAAKPGGKMKLGFVTYLWGQDWELPTLIANLEKTKVLGVELRVEHAHGVGPDLTAEQRAEVKKRFADSPVEVLGMGTNQCYDHVSPERLKEDIEGTKAYIKLSHDIGGTGVKVKPNALHEKEGIPKEKTIEQIGKSLNEVGAFAADYGQKIRVEVHGRETCELPIMKAIMDVATHPNVYVCWNCNDNDLNGEGLEYNFNLVKDRFGDTVHAREFNIGEYPYQDLMKLFVGMDYAGWICLEARTKPEDRVAALAEQREVWEGMIAKAQA